MNRSIRSLIAPAAVALAALGAAGVASARTDAYVTVAVGTPTMYVRDYVAPAPVYVAPRTVTVAPEPVYRVQEGYGGYYAQHNPWRDEHACRAMRWDPHARYMPGDAVWRHGQVYVARGVSAHVWNVNSPPEWTPDYWRPARCD